MLSVGTRGHNGLHMNCLLLLTIILVAGNYQLITKQHFSRTCHSLHRSNTTMTQQSSKEAHSLAQKRYQHKKKREFEEIQNDLLLLKEAHT